MALRILNQFGEPMTHPAMGASGAALRDGSAGGNGNGHGRNYLQDYITEMDQRAKDPAFSVKGAPPNFAQYPVPHVMSFQGLFGTFSHVYRPSDEAIKDSLENARFMRNDPGIMECVEHRQRASALLDWHIEPEDEDSDDQKQLCEELTKLLTRIPRFMAYRYNLMHAIWYGKYGVQHRYRWVNLGGKMRLIPYKLRDNPGWIPVNGDKLVFRYDDGRPGTIPDQVGIRVGSRFTALQRVNDRWSVEPTDRGLAYFLQDWERPMIAIHKHMIEDGAWEEGIDAGVVHGVGIRSRIYWDWFQKQQALALLMEYLERSAGGIEIWYYPAGNPSAERDMRTAAEQRIGNQRNIMLVPRLPGDDGFQEPVQVIEPGMSGVNALQEILTSYFGHRIKRYILGQTLSSEAQATGLGSGLAELHLDTFLSIVKFDATNLEETISDQLLQYVKDWNFPHARSINVRFVIETESQGVEERLAAYHSAWEMGAKIKASDVYEAIGTSAPEGNEEVLENPQIGQDGMGGMPGMGGPEGPGGGGGGPFTGPGPGELKATMTKQVSDALGIETTSTADAQTQQAMSAYFDEAEAGANITYVDSDGNWSDREADFVEGSEGFDTGEREREKAVKRFRKPWDETQHPRAPDGRFGSKPGQSAAATEKPPGQEPGGGSETPSEPEPVGIPPLPEAVPNRMLAPDEVKGLAEQLETPQTLPENPDLFFKTDEADLMVPLDKVRPTRAREDGIRRAGRIMWMTAAGRAEKRSPINVHQLDDGTFEVMDGNSTFANAKNFGWKSLPAKLVTPDEQQQLDSAKKAEKVLAELEQNSLGIPRHDMPQIIREHQDEFLHELTKRGIGHRQAQIPAGELKGTQKELNIDKVLGMAEAMRNGTMTKDAPPVLASSDGYILDGHHRWGAQRVVDPSKPMNLIQVGLPIEELLDESYNFDNVQFAGVQHKEPVSKPKPDIKSKAKIDQSEMTTASIKTLQSFGIDDTASSVGAPDDSTVTASQSHDGEFVSVGFSGKGYTAQRYFTRRPDGVHCMNAHIDIEQKGTGLGTKIFSKQVEQLAKQGVKTIQCEAVRDDNPERPAIGYKVWPKMGYDGAFDLTEGGFSAEQVPPEVRGAKTIQDVYRSKTGREWWDKNGWDVHLSFDLAEGSRSRKILDKYLRRKAASGKIPEVYGRESLPEWYARYRSATSAGGPEEPDLDEQELADLDTMWEEIDGDQTFDSEPENGEPEKFGRRWSKSLIRGRVLDVERYRAKKKALAGQKSLFDWDEEDHPRDETGQFTEKGTGHVGAKPKPVDEAAGPAHEDEFAGDGEADEPEGVPGLPDDAGGRSDRLDGAGDREGGESGAGEDGGTEGLVPARRERPERDRSTGNWRYPDREFVGGGLKEKFRRNIDAIKALRAIEAEGRSFATAEEQETLSKFTGWGQFGQPLFKTYPDENWKKEQAELQSVLNDREFDEAKKSSGADDYSYQTAKKATLNSHFTSPQIVDAHWRIAQKLGFTGGRYLEPSVGSGYYLGMMPPELAKRTSVTGVELDRTTAQIAEKLYPSATIKNQGFETYKAPDGFYDLVASNVPFGDYKIHEKRYNKFQAPIHDHFFLKSVDKARPGGLVMHITSTGTLDKPNDRIRKELASKADLISAIRLPGSTHGEAAGTEVVTDLVILRKHGPAGASPEETPAEVSEQVKPGFTGLLTDSLGRVYRFVNGKRVPNNFWTETTKVPDPAGGEEIGVNSYFEKYGDDILGTLDRTGTMYGPGQKNVTPPEDFDAALEAAIERIPEGLYEPVSVREDQFAPDAQPAADDMREGNYVVKDGTLYQQQQGMLVERGDISEADLARIEAAVAVRGPLREVIRKDLAGEPSADDRERLNRAYDEFVSKHGALHERANVKALHDDPDMPLLLSLEEWNAKSKTAEKADIFSQVTIRPNELPKSADSTAEALGIVLNQSGTIDVSAMARLTGQTIDQVEDELRETGLAYEDPEEGWTDRSSYLSGNVRKKLELSKAAAENDDRFEVNVHALEAALPEDIDYEDISTKLGTPWVPGEDMNAFAAKLLNSDADQFDIKYSPELGKWMVEKSKNARSYGFGVAERTWGTDTHSAMAILGGVMNNKVPKAYQYDADGNRELDVTATEMNNEKAQQMRDEFADWIWDDDERRERLHRHYNDNYNNIVPQEYDGSHLTFPGMLPSWELRKTAANFAWQVISRGKGILAHEVGVGKAQPLDAKILTPTGWRRMGDIQVGDTVIAGDGSPTCVEAVYPQGEKEIYSVQFNDGSSTECCKEHLWLTQTYRERCQAINEPRFGKSDWNCSKPKVRELSEIMETLRAPHLNAKNHSIPVVGTVQFDERAVPIDPYTMGALLGDGSFGRMVRLHSADREVGEYVSRNLPKNVKVTTGRPRVIAGADGTSRVGKCFTYSFASVKLSGFGADKSPSPMRLAVRSLGLDGKKSHEKFVPDCYKFNSPEVRLAVLQGLMDTDGTVSPSGTCVSFTSTSTRLADDVAFLAMSLGGVISSRKSRVTKYRKNGILTEGRESHTLVLRLPPDVHPFRLSRKANKVVPKTKYLPARYIVDVEPVGTKQAQCIRVSHPSHLYVTDDFIVTHNTATMVASAMELRRLGLAKKPAIVALKSNLEQLTAEAQELYPGARILSTAGNFTAAKRKEMVSKMATGDYDMVFMSQDHLNMLPMSGETQARFIQDELTELEGVIGSVSETDKTAQKRTVKQLEKRKASLEAKLKEALDSKKDDAVTFEETGIDFLFVDECFPGETEVITDQGTKTIGEIVENRLRVSVLSCNRATHQLEYRPITSWFKRELKNHLVRVRHSSGSFVCTPNHNIWTEEDGYVKAGLLQSHHTLRCLPNGVPSQPREMEAGQGQVLQPGLRQRRAEETGLACLQAVQKGIRGASQQGGREAGVLQQVVLGEGTLAAEGTSGEGGGWHEGRHDGRAQDCHLSSHDGEQSDVRPRSAGQDEAVLAWQEVLASRRQREADETANPSGVHLGVDTGICHIDGRRAQPVPVDPQFLQSRSCPPDHENLCRSGWSLAPTEESQAAGPEENGRPQFSRVVSVALHQRAGDERTVEGGEGDRFVYDIEVSGNHNYFADGVNVSNSHAYKNLPVYTAMGQVLGVPTASSQRATNMLMRTRWLQEQNNGRGVVFATGTPVSNTMAEAYNLQRYIQPEELKERGIDNFDAWANTFGEMETALEPDLKGGYKERTRFSRFNNVPEMMQILRQDMDVRRVKNLFNDDGTPMVPRPNRIDHMVLSPANDVTKQMMANINSRAEEVSGKQPEKGADNVLSISTDGRQGSVDARLYAGGMFADDHPDSKVNKMVKNVLDRYHNPETSDQSQLIFSDIGVNPNRESGFHLYQDIIDKLVAGGIPREEIADFGALKSKKKERLDAAAGLNNGKIKVGIGGTQTMGTGLNVQKRLGALHHLDIPYVPTAMEQRDGRGHRFGNRNKDVNIYRYVSEGTLDEMSWGIVSRKASFIQQAVTDPTAGQRSLTEEDAEVLTPQQLMAAASGDTRILDRVNLQHSLKQMRRSKTRHDRDQANLRNRIASTENAIRESTNRIANMQRDAEHLESVPDFSLRIGGNSYTSRKEAQDALDFEAKLRAEKDAEIPPWRRRYIEDEPEPIGEYRGLPLTPVRGGYAIEAPSGETYVAGESIRSLDHVARSIPKRIEREREEQEKMRSDLESIRGNVGKAFSREQQLADMEAELKRLDAELKIGEPERHSRSFVERFNRRFLEEAERYGGKIRWNPSDHPRAEGGKFAPKVAGYRDEKTGALKRFPGTSCLKGTEEARGKVIDEIVSDGEASDSQIESLSAMLLTRKCAMELLAEFGLSEEDSGKVMESLDSFGDGLHSARQAVDEVLEFLDSAGSGKDRYSSAWEDDLHPRDENGQFIESGSGGAEDWSEGQYANAFSGPHAGGAGKVKRGYPEAGGKRKPFSEMDIKERKEAYKQIVYDDQTLPDEHADAFAAAAMHAQLEDEFDFAALADDVWDYMQQNPGGKPVTAGIVVGNRWNAESRKRHSDAQLNRAGKARVVMLRNKNTPESLIYVAHPSTQPGFSWQLSMISPDGTPYGHYEFDDRDEAIKSVTGHPDIRAYDQIGGTEYEVQWTSEDGTKAPFSKRGLVERYRLEPSRYRGKPGAEWVTVGGQSHDGKKHVGGQPVKVEDDGKIVAGPAAIKGKDIDELGEPDWFDQIGTEDRAQKFEDADESSVREAIERGESVPARVMAKFPQLAKERSEALSKDRRLKKTEELKQRHAERLREYRERKGTNSVPSEAAPVADATGEDDRQAGPADEPPPPPPWFRGGRSRSQWLDDREQSRAEPSPPPEQSSEDKYRGVVRKPDGRYVGAAQVHKEDLAVDPHRFQYKISDIDYSTGTTKELKEVGRFRPEFAGQLLVWNDPETDQAYVVNGHHRYELAHRLNYDDELSVFFIDAKDATEARSIGALANMAEGRGTAVDAAKFMRDNNKSAADLKKEGISLKGKIADDGTILAKLSDHIFHKVATQQMREGRALAIGRELDDHDAQNKILNYINQREERGRKIPDSIVAEMAREVAQTPSRSYTEKSLFGEETRDESLFLERAQLKSHLRDKLAEQARAFKAVASEQRRGTLEEGGKNVIDTQYNQQAAQQAAEGLYDFDREVNLKGPLSDAVNRAAEELANDPRSRKQIQTELLTTIQRLIAGEGNQTDTGGVEGGHRGGAGDAGTRVAGDDGGLERERIVPAAGQTAMAFSRRGFVDRFNRAFAERYGRN